MLEIEDLHASYGKIAAVRGVSTSAHAGRVTLVLGANGAGKSTMLRSVAGLHTSMTGRVSMNGRDISRWDAHRVVEEGVVLVPEGRRMFGPLTVEENLRLGGYTAAKGTFEAAVQQVYDLFPILYERRSGASGLLSGGEQQMLAFGRALMSEPKVMLMDEPSMGLAPAVVDLVLSRVRDIASSGIGVLVVEQNAEVGLEIADDVVVLARGEGVFYGTAEVARSHTSIVRAFLGEAALTTAEPERGLSV
ncbi:ABC transporter ATP-binding protein [Rhodococcus opacus]